MRPLTETVPKSMLPVCRPRPFIAHQLELLATQDVRDVVVCCGFLGNQIETFIGDGSSFGCRVRYSFDGPELKGTGGAIKQAYSSPRRLVFRHVWRQLSTHRFQASLRNSSSKAANPHS